MPVKGWTEDGMREPQEAFIVTVGVRGGAFRKRDCDRALAALRRDGFMAGPTSEESLIALAEQAKLTLALEANDEEPGS